MSEKQRSQDLTPGQAIQHTVTIHRSRSTYVIPHPPQYIGRRKDDDSGWWLTDHSGIDDDVFDRLDEWQAAGSAPDAIDNDHPTNRSTT